jgi:Sulfotransferase family
MLVSHRYRFIYTKTAKTGATSVESYFEPFCMAEGEWTRSHEREEYVSPSGIVGFRVGFGEVRPVAKHTWWHHMPARLIRRKLGEETWQRYFKFCVIRNPYEKAISAFYYRRRMRRRDSTSIEADRLQFERWLELKGPPIDRNKYVIREQFCLDDVVRYESLRGDLERICNRLGVPWEPEQLPNFKAGIRPPGITAQDLYTERSREIVCQAYAFELEYFGYSFPESPPR